MYQQWTDPGFLRRRWLEDGEASKSKKWADELTYYSGGSRIFPRGGANSQNCYYFSHFCRKLHENERIWTPGGGARPWRPPLDPPMYYFYHFPDENFLKIGLNGPPTTCQALELN